MTLFFICSGFLQHRQLCVQSPLFFQNKPLKTFIYLPALNYPDLGKSTCDILAIEPGYPSEGGYVGNISHVSG